MRIILVTCLVSAWASGAAAQAVPTINIEPSCRAAAAGVSITKGDVETCRRSELAARDALVEQWHNFPATDRKSCHSLTTTGTPGTYTELLTCLEMKRDVRKLPDTSTVGRGTRN